MVCYPRVNDIYGNVTFKCPPPQTGPDRLASLQVCGITYLEYYVRLHCNVQLNDPNKMHITPT